MGFTVLVPGAHYGVSIYYGPTGHCYPDIQDANEVPRGTIESLQHRNSAGAISPIEAPRFLVNKLSGAILQHVIYGVEMNLCFKYNDREYGFVMRFAFDQYATA